jgi:long-chain acyl-CoA synthetase
MLGSARASENRGGTSMWGTTSREYSSRGRRFRIFEPRPPCVGAVIDEAIAAWSAREFVVQGEQRLTFAAVGRSLDVAATRLAEAGIAPGDHVGLLAANSPAWVVTFLALLRFGAVAVLGNGWWPRDEIKQAFADAQVSLVVTDAGRRSKTPEGVAALDLDDLVAPGTPGPPPPAVSEDAPAYIVFTSGSTARPKAAVLSHRSTVANLHNILVRTNQLPPLDPTRPPGVNLCAVPLFHISGVQTILQHLVVGGRLVFLEGRFDPARVIDLIEAERVTSWTAVPTMLAMVLDQPDIDERDLSTVRSLAVGGAPVAPALLERADRVFTRARRRLAVSYGSTEAGGTVATGLRSDGEGALVPLETVDLRIDAPDEEGIGEILVRAPTVMEGYLEAPESEQPVTRDGWLHTGDLGVLHEGRLRIVGRVKDIVIRGGENVSAAHVETTLREHPAVADVAVVGLAHPTWGEEVAAAVQLAPGSGVTEAELRSFASARIAHFAVPTRWMIVDSALPITDTGKVSKPAIRALFTGTAPSGPGQQRRDPDPDPDPDSGLAAGDGRRDEEAFRAEVRAWLEAECPGSMREPVVGPADLVFGGRRARFPSPDARVWLERMAARGWTAPRWPQEYGGAGLSDREAQVLAAELARLGCRQPLVSVHGIGMVGPVLLRFGSDEQRKRFLPPTARGEVRWCQGFSEPAVGSDLAAVRTRALRDGDGYVLTGQKVWTSWATESDWIFVLARTDPSVPKRDGLSFFLVDLAAPGVHVRPIRLLSGASEFCEVFLDDVRVSVDERVGSEGDGWTIARLVLEHERQMFGQGTGMMTQRLAPPDLAALARAHLAIADGEQIDDDVRDEIVRLDIELDCIRAALRRARRGGDPLHPSMLKHSLSELMQAQADLAGRVTGTRSLGWSGAAFDDELLAATRDYLFSRAWTIAGGSTEIQLNIIARRILELPHLGPEQDS